MSVDTKFNFYENFNQNFYDEFLYWLSAVRGSECIKPIQSQLHKLMININKTYGALKRKLFEYNSSKPKEENVKVKEARIVLNSLNMKHPHKPFTIEGLKIICLLGDSLPEFGELGLAYYNQLEEIDEFYNRTIQENKIEFEGNFLLDKTEGKEAAYYIGYFQSPYVEDMYKRYMTLKGMEEFDNIVKRK